MLPKTQNPNTSHKPALYTFGLKMSSTTHLTLEERFEALMKQNEILMKTLSEDAKRDEETKAQNEYLQK